MVMVTVRQHPFPHAIFDDYWDEELLEAVRHEIPEPDDPRWRRYHNDKEGKLEGNSSMWGPRTHELFEAIEQLGPVLGDYFEIPNLSMETIGGGYHLIPPGGRLDIHTDFNRSPGTDLHRRLNLLVYLNRDWDDPGGHLELRCVTQGCRCGGGVRITPEFNRTVVFETSDRSWHGHPVRAQRWWASVAAYFFSPEPPPGYTIDHSTVWFG